MIKTKDWKYTHRDFDLYCSRHCFLVAVIQSPKRKRQRFERHTAKHALDGASVWSPKHRISFRSNYELKVANFFDACGFNYRYEPYVFKWDGHVYTPDFYVVDHNCFVEVKGHFYMNKKKKLTSFIEAYPDVNLILLPWILHSEFK